MHDLTGAPSGWPEDLQAQWTRAMRDVENSTLAWRTPHSRGEPELREALAEMLGVGTDDVTVVSSVRAAAVVLGRCRAVALVERPTFLEIPRILASAGAQLRLVTWAELAETLEQEEPARCLAWVTSPARNPDGESLDPALMSRLRRAASAGALVVHNEIHRWYVPGSGPKVPTGAVRVGSLSKLAGGGARVGWVVHAPAEADWSLRLISPPTPWQRAWALFLRRVSWARLIDAFTDPVVRARQAFISAAGESISGRITGAAANAPTTLLPLGTVTEDRAHALLAERGLLTGRGRDFLSPYPSLRLAFTALSAEGAHAAGRILCDALAEHPELAGIRADARARTDRGKG